MRLSDLISLNKCSKLWPKNTPNVCKLGRKTLTIESWYMPRKGTRKFNPLNLFTFEVLIWLMMQYKMFHIFHNAETALDFLVKFSIIFSKKFSNCAARLTCSDATSPYDSRKKTNRWKSLQFIDWNKLTLLLFNLSTILLPVNLQRKN